MLSSFNAGPGWYVGQSYEGYLPKTRRGAINRNSGKCDREPNHIYWKSHWANKWIDINKIGSYKVTRNVMGG